MRVLRPYPATTTRYSPAMRPSTVGSLLAVVQHLDRPDAWHRAAARQRLAGDAAPGRAAAVPPALAGALAALERAWDADVAAAADRAWAELVTPAERAGRVNAQAVVRRATAAQVAALCLGRGRSVATAWRDWYRRFGGAVPGQRTWSGRRGA